MSGLHIPKAKSLAAILAELRGHHRPPRPRFPWDEWPALPAFVTQSEGEHGLGAFLFGTSETPGLARYAGWHVAHIRDSRLQPDAIGFPDWVAVREVVIFAELKRNTDRLSPEQAAWGGMLLSAGYHYYVWRPQDWASIGRVILDGPERATEEIRA